MRVYFVKNNVETQIPDDSVMYLSYSASLFSDTFKLGSTLCRAFDLEVLKSAVATQPDYVLIKEQSGQSWVTYAQLIVDQLDESNTLIYKYKLCDRMMLGNVSYDASSIFVDEQTTLGAIVNNICSIMGVTPPQSFYKDSMTVSFYDNTYTARDYLGYVAELQGGYARISASNALEFVTFTTASVDTISLDDCSDFELGAKYEIDRVGFNNGTNSVFYPNEDTGNQTVYINSSNVYFENTDIEHIYDALTNEGANPFIFYLLKVSNCPINKSVQAGNIVTINNYPTIADINWTYNIIWLGGYELDIDTPKQEETQIKGGVEERMKSLKIIVDRNTNQITQVATSVTANTESINSLDSRVANTESNVANNTNDINNTRDTVTQMQTAITQNESAITAEASARVTAIDDLNNELSNVKTKVQIDAEDGVKITKNNDNNYVLVNDSGMEIYVDGAKVAEAVADGFDATQLVVDSMWAMDTTENGTVFNIWRK